MAFPPGSASPSTGPGTPLPEKMSSLVPPPLVGEEEQRCRRLGIDVIAVESGGELGILAEIPHSPTRVYRRGGALPPWRWVVAVVGSRRATPLGLRQAYRLGRELTDLGLTVISGLARGIDSSALEGALAAGGRPGAVLGNGLPRIYPPENLPLSRRMESAGGFLITEFPLDTPPRRRNFPYRNRLISGLAAAVVVVEASLRSGSLSTAGWALEQGREVMAFPGPSEGPAYQGCHRLLRDGAALVTGVEEVIAQLAGIADAPKEGWREKIALARSAGARSPQELLEATGLPATLILRGWCQGAGEESSP